MKVIGYRKSDFRAKDGTEVKGYNLYLSGPITTNGQGYEAERVYLSENKIGQIGVSMEEIYGHEVKLSYNRWGKISNIEIAD